MKSDYIIYVDESGDHGLSSIDSDYPIFVLSFCCFQIDNYTNNVVPLLQKFKFKYFGHDQIILHEHHIRKQKGDFSFLRTDKEFRTHFLENINQIMENIEMDIFSVVIDKTKLTKKYKFPENPYNLSLLFGLERVRDFLIKKGQENKEIFFIFEKRGAKEDKELELEFRRICDDTSFSTIKFSPFFADKKSNSTGLQIADLTARPIGLSYLRTTQENRAYHIIKNKIQVKKVFPQ